MTNSHSKTFFGQKTGLMIKSNSKVEPFIFLICFKKKYDGTWEKPSKGDGKIIKCSLEEIAMILEVLNTHKSYWQNSHDYNGLKTTISFEWENKNFSNLWIKIGDYRRYLDFGEIKVMNMLLNHLLKEKIIHATIAPIEKKLGDRNNFLNSNLSPNKTKYTKISKNENDISIQSQEQGNFRVHMTEVRGIIKKVTRKALLIAFSPGNEYWIPKSTIHNNYFQKTEKQQKFLIDDWILEKNDLIAQ